MDKILSIKRKTHVFAAAMLFGAYSTALVDATAVGTCMNAAIFRNPIAFAHTLMTNAFAAI